jgi:uncharacterized repeat protein (TIGR01451 family)
MEYKRKITSVIISAMVLFALLSVFTTSASATCNGGSVRVLVTNPGGTGGGAYPYDTFVMWRTCELHLDTWTTQQKQDIVDWIYAGGKLIIWDTECTGNPDYSWLPFSFTTNNPGAWGATGWPLTILEENTLSSALMASSYYIDTAIISTTTDAVGDANVMTVYSSTWCQDMEAENRNRVTGPVHVYARYGSGLMVYCGLDADHITRTTTGGTHLRNILINELNQPWGDEACGLPCNAPIPPGVLTVDKTGDKTVMDVSDTVTFTITVTNTGTSAITGINLIDILPPELSTADPLSYSIGTLNPGDSSTTTITATADSTGPAVQNVARATGTDASGNTVGDDDTFTVKIGGVPVPEFTAIAIPIASILGLLLFSLRKQRKEEE